ncbi:hypothetical protein BH11BAC2_BH11BAC2_04410 [soil metagenome]
MEEVKKNSDWKWLKLIILLGLLFRILFIVVGGKFYFGTPDFKIQGDTYGWIDSIMNLIRNGTYSSDLNVPNASFFRPPGFGFLIGIFYFIGGQNMDTGLQLLSWFQILLDTLAIWMIYKIAINMGTSPRASLISAFLYATYPFIIVWTPVLYAESSSVFFMISSLYFLSDAKTYKRNFIYSGIFAGIAVLTRLQCIFLIPGLAYFAWNLSNRKINFKSGLISFLLCFGLVYGLWPARNLIFQDRLVFSQDLRVGKHWSPDYLAFMDYIFSIKTDHQPEYQQIIENQKLDWPQDAYVHPGDSFLLAETIEKCRTCGTGFSYFKYHAGLIKAPLGPNENCDSLIEYNFQQLTRSQKDNNKLNYYIKTPISNLKKALFKLSLYGDKSTAVKAAGATLFSYRTLLILLGIIASIMNYRKKWFNPVYGTMALSYFVLWYFFLCFVYRNMEIRYLLHCDLLLLIPCAAMIAGFFSKTAVTNIPKKII